MISMSSSPATILNHIRKMQKKKRTQLSCQEHPKEEEEEEGAKFWRYNKIHMMFITKKKPTFQRQQSTFPYIKQRTGHPKQQKNRTNHGLYIKSNKIIPINQTWFVRRRRQFRTTMEKIQKNVPIACSRTAKKERKKKRKGRTCWSSRRTEGKLEGRRVWRRKRMWVATVGAKRSMACRGMGEGLERGEGIVGDGVEWLLVAQGIRLRSRKGSTAFALWRWFDETCKSAPAPGNVFLNTGFLVFIFSQNY